MQTNNNVSFKATRLGMVKVPAKIDKQWKEIPMSFVRLHAKENPGDRLALEEVKNLWNGKNLSASMQEQSAICNDPVFAITTQSANFRNLDPKKIKALMTTNRFEKGADTAEIFRIGVSPEHAYEQHKNKREIKHLASTLVKKFVEMINKKTNVERVVAVAQEPSEARFLQKIKMPETGSNIRYQNFELKKEQFEDFLK